MKLLTKEILQRLPKYPQNESTPVESIGDLIAQVKFFTPFSNWTWYGVYYDGVDIFWGFVEGIYPETGSFSLKELEEIKGVFGLGVERDMYFKPTALKDIPAFKDRW